MSQSEVILEPVAMPIAASGSGTREIAAARARLVAHLRSRHLTMLWLSCAIIAASFVLNTQGAERVTIAGFPGLVLPGMCGSRALFGVECPGCGLTRSFIALAGGNVAGSFAFHRLGWLLAATVVLQIPYRLFALRELHSGISARQWPVWFGYALIAALLLNWLLKAAAGGV